MIHTSRMPAAPHRSPLLWVVAADGHHAQIYQRTATEKFIPMPGDRTRFNRTVNIALAPLFPKPLEAEPLRTELGRDVVGRVQESAVNGMRHMVDPKTDAYEAEKDRFTREVAMQINAAHEARRFEELVLVAPPRTLGRLREYLNPQVRACLIAEIDKDFTHLTPAEVTERLKELT